MEFDPQQFRIRPWQTALVAVVAVTGLVFVFAPEVPLLGTSADSQPSVGPTSGAPSGTATNSSSGEDPQAIVSQSNPIVPGVSPSYGAPQNPLMPGVVPTQGLPRSQTTCVAQSSDVSLKVLTFNTHIARHGVGSEAQQIAREIAAVDPDIAMLQEVGRRPSVGARADQPAFYSQQLGMDYAFGPNERENGGEFGTLTLSKYPIISQSNTSLPNDPNSSADHQRGVLHTQIQVGDTVVSVYNTHLQYNFTATRMKQIQTVMGLIRNDPAPRFLAGDFNSGAHTPTYDVANSVLKDSWEAAGSGPGLTVPAGNPKYRIDFLFYSDPLVPQTSQVLPQSQVSDHRGVLSTFSMSGGGQPICVPVFDEPLQ